MNNENETIFKKWWFWDNKTTKLENFVNEGEEFVVVLMSVIWFKEKEYTNKK